MTLPLPLAATLASAGLLVSAGLTCGGVALLGSGWLGLPPHLAFFGGMSLPALPIVLYRGRPAWVAAELARCAEWEKEGLITPDDAKLIREAIVGSMIRHRYGGPTPKPVGHRLSEPESIPAPRSKSQTPGKGKPKGKGSPKN